MTIEYLYIVRRSFETIAFVVLMTAGRCANAHHIPMTLDVPNLWMKMPGSGYLEFFISSDSPIKISPVGNTKALPFGHIGTEEHTGWSDEVGGTDSVDPVGPLFPGPDNHEHAGDFADFDWVQEHRLDEDPATATVVNHVINGVKAGGPLGWRIMDVQGSSPHITNGSPHTHLGLSDPVGNAAFGDRHFNRVDVFSASLRDPALDEPDRRNAALDYDLWFVNQTTKQSVPGYATKVWEPGWTHATDVDDFIARWAPMGVSGNPGMWDAIAIDPRRSDIGDGHDDVTEIDAVVAYLFRPGDADEDWDFDQFDIVKILTGAKYLSGQPATWGEGDFNEDGVFDALDIIAALAGGLYTTGPYHSSQPMLQPTVGIITDETGSDWVADSGRSSTVIQEVVQPLGGLGKEGRLAHDLSAAHVAVPEPSACALVSVCFLFMTSFRRGRRAWRAP